MSEIKAKSKTDNVTSKQVLLLAKQEDDASKRGRAEQCQGRTDQYQDD